MNYWDDIDKAITDSSKGRLTHPPAWARPTRSRPARLAAQTRKFQPAGPSGRMIAHQAKGLMLRAEVLMRQLGRSRTWGAAHNRGSVSHLINTLTKLQLEARHETDPQSLRALQARLSMARVEIGLLDGKAGSIRSNDHQEIDDTIAAANTFKKGAKMVGSTALAIGSGGSPAASGAASALFDGIDSAATQHFEDGEVDVGKVAKDAAVGGIKGYVSGAVADKMGLGAGLGKAEKIVDGVVGAGVSEAIDRYPRPVRGPVPLPPVKAAPRARPQRRPCPPLALRRRQTRRMATTCSTHSRRKAPPCP